MRIFLAALLGGLAIFVWLAIAHMFTPLGEAGLDYLPQNDTVGAALTAALGPQPGTYLFPTGGLTKEASSADKEAGMRRIMEEMRTKPSGMLIYKPAGSTFNFGKNLAVEFLTDWAVALLAVLLLAQTHIVSFAGRVGFIVLVGLLAAITANVPFWNWYGISGTYALANMFMEVVALLLAGLAIAAVYKPAVPLPAGGNRNAGV